MRCHFGKLLAVLSALQKRIDPFTFQTFEEARGTALLYINEGKIRSGVIYFMNYLMRNQLQLGLDGALVSMTARGILDGHGISSSKAREWVEGFQPRSFFQ